MWDDWKFGKSEKESQIPNRYKGGSISLIDIVQDEIVALKAEGPLK